VLPNFLVIGAMKAGTTSLYHYLRAHPQVFMPQRKELDFFVASKGWVQGRAWYEAQFAGAEGAVAVGEASPSYAMHPEYPGVADRIAELLPQVRLIYAVRHPIERMRSHYLHELQLGREHAPIGQALVDDPRYLDTSRYGMQLERYLARFPAERLQVICAEELREQRAATIRRVLEFLAVDPDRLPPTLDTEFHRTATRRVRRPVARAVLSVPGARVLRQLAPRPVRRLASRRVPAPSATIPAAVQARLRRELQDDIGRLRAHLGAGFHGWGLA
jgi:hypothetical protein